MDKLLYVGCPKRSFHLSPAWEKNGHCFGLTLNTVLMMKCLNDYCFALSESINSGI
jgi:hypothetical protein